MLSDLYGGVLFIVLEMGFEGVLDGGGIDSGEYVSIFGGVVYMYDMRFGEFMFHREEDL